MAALLHVTNWCNHACGYTGQVQQPPIVYVGMSVDHAFDWAGVGLNSTNHHYVR